MVVTTSTGDQNDNFLGCNCNFQLSDESDCMGLTTDSQHEVNAQLVTVTHLLVDDSSSIASLSGHIVPFPKRQH